MYAGTQLLNEDGSASIATTLLLSHHGFRRDIAQFARTLGAGGAGLNIEAVRAHWNELRATLHGHHEAEDTRLFPSLLGHVAALAPVVERLTAEHQRIDPLLLEADRAFEQLPHTEPTLRAVAELGRLLEPHLETEETQIFPLLRGAKEFPPAESEVELAMFADGFAWASHGVAAEVIERVDAMLPGGLSSRLPAARAAFGAKYERAFGGAGRAAARTSVPDVWRHWRSDGTLASE